MSKEFKDLLTTGEDLQYALKKFLDKYEKAEENTVRSALSVEERSDFVALYQAQDKIYDAYMLLRNLDKHVRAEGYLEKNGSDRYEVEGIELNSGTYVEFFSPDDDGGCYVTSRVEHNGEDYYIVALGKAQPIEGIKVRIK